MITSYQARNVPEVNGFRLVTSAIALTLQSRTVNAQTRIPWPLVYSLAQWLMWRAQRGLASEFAGQIKGPNGEWINIVMEVTQSILDSAEEIHGGLT